jgi:hypothetical protein
MGIRKTPDPVTRVQAIKKYYIYIIPESEEKVNGN